MFGAIEAGGTKFVCGVGTGPDNLLITQIPTSDPIETLSAVLNFFAPYQDKLKAVGIGSFGPIDLNCDSPSYGHITSTPKDGWQNFNIVKAVGDALHVPVAFDTDVNAAALGEGRWGAAMGLSDFVYLTVGTGIGGGAIINGQVLHGLIHPEMGHIKVSRALAEDSYSGFCPYHGDCLEGLASGPALQERWGRSVEKLPDNHEAWELEAHYLALGLSSMVCILSPRRIVLGGGVMKKSLLFPLIRQKLVSLFNGYIRADELFQGLDNYVVPSKLQDRAGVLGAIVLAERAVGGRGGALGR
jgi:fructokinase